MVENEIQYVPWQQFKQMVPSILGLEVTRLTHYLTETTPPTEVRNTVVKVRYDIKQFAACIAAVECADANRCATHLSSALLHAALLPKHPSLAYVTDRLRYVRDRMPYIY